MEQDEKVEFFEKYVDYSPYQEDIMTLAQILHNEGKAEGKVEGNLEGKAEGKAQGKAEGKIEGQIDLVLDLHARGEITSAAARASLRRLAQTGPVPKKMIDQALLTLTKRTK